MKESSQLNCLSFVNNTGLPIKNALTLLLLRMESTLLQLVRRACSEYTITSYEANLQQHSRRFQVTWSSQEKLFFQKTFVMHSQLVKATGYIDGLFMVTKLCLMTLQRSLN